MPPGLTSQQERRIQYWEGTLEHGSTPAFRIGQCRALRAQMPLENLPTTPFIEAVCADVPVVTDTERANQQRALAIRREITVAYESDDPDVLAATCERLIPEAEELGGRTAGDVRGSCESYQRSLHLRAVDNAEYSPNYVQHVHVPTEYGSGYELGPGDTMEYCAGWVMSCFSDAGHDIDDCFHSAPICDGDQPWENRRHWACCPRSCINRFVEQRRSGTGASAALMSALSGRPSCIPELEVLLPQ
jgi:hypothetical protein